MASGASCFAPPVERLPSGWRSWSEASQSRAFTSAARPALAPGPARASAADQIFEAYCCARTKTGEGAAGISRESLNGLLKKQTATLHKQHPDARISFRVVVEGNRAKIKASVGRT